MVVLAGWLVALDGCTADGHDAAAAASLGASDDVVAAQRSDRPVPTGGDPDNEQPCAAAPPTGKVVPLGVGFRELQRLVLDTSTQAELAAYELEDRYEGGQTMGPPTGLSPGGRGRRNLNHHLTKPHVRSCATRSRVSDAGPGTTAASKHSTGPTRQIHRCMSWCTSSRPRRVPGRS